MRRRMIRVARVGIASLAAIALTACGSSEQQSNPSAISADAASLAQIRRIDPDANRLLAGGEDQFRGRVAAARGQSIVVNQWAS